MHWRDWRRPVDVTQGHRRDLVVRGDGLSFPDGISVTYGPRANGAPDPVYEYVWRVYAQDNKIWIERSDLDYTEWVYRTEFVQAPTGSQRPSITFDDQHHYAIAVEFTPAGSEQPEIWLCEYPYTGPHVRRVAQGTHPIVTMEFRSGMTVFYRNPDGAVAYRTAADDFETEHVVDGIDGIPTAARVVRRVLLPVRPGRSPGLRSQRSILFTKPAAPAAGQPKYLAAPEVVVSDAEDRVAVRPRIQSVGWEKFAYRVKFFLRYEFTFEPIEGATVKFLGREAVSGPDGIADFGVIGIPMGSHEFSVVLPTETEIQGWALTIDSDVTIEVPILGTLPLTEPVGVGAEVAGIEWEDTRVSVTFTVLRDDNPEANARVEFGEFVEYTDSTGTVVFPTVVAGEYQYTVTTTDDIVMRGTVVVDGPMDVTVYVIEPPTLTEPVEVEASVGIEWLDTQAWLNFTVLADDEAVQGAIVRVTRLFDGKVYEEETDADGGASVLVTAAEYTLTVEASGYAVYRGRVTVQPQVDVDIDVALHEQWPEPAETLGVEAGVDSILWVEV